MWSLDLTGSKYEVTQGAAWTGGDDSFDPATSWSSQDFTTNPGALTADGDKKVALEGDHAGLGMGDSFTLTMDCRLTGVGGNDTSDTKYWLMSVNQNQASWFVGVQYDTTTKQICFGNADHTLSDEVSYGKYELTDIRTVALVMSGAMNDDGEMAIYINGEMAASATMAAGDRHTNAGWNNGVVFMNKMSEHDGVAGTITGAKLYNTALYSTAPIPEPTTATLSLLALAGLAARRRRR